MDARRLGVALLAVALAGIWVLRRPTAERATDPVDWQRDPIQEPTARAPFQLPSRHGAVTILPRARYDLAAVVVSRERYWLDASAFLSPLDLAVAWGPAAGRDVRRRVDFYQGDRFVIWSTHDRTIDLAAFARHVANVHTLPADDTVRAALLDADPGDVVRLTGLLVDARAEDGFRWKTSLTRNDDGPGSCEVMWVESVQVGDRLYR